MSYKLKKELGLLNLFCIASGAMISSGLFILPGLAYAKTGPSVILAYFLASIFVIPAMLSKIELATAMPKAGGTYFFIDRCMGPRMGTIGGFAAWFSLALKSAFALIGIGVFALLLNPGFTEMQMKLIAVAFCVILTIINLVGVKHAGKTQIALVGALLCLLVLYTVVGSFSIQFSRFAPLAPRDFGSFFATVGLVFVSFGGLTKIASVAEEVKNPRRNIPRGMFFAWVFISLLYILVISVTVGVVDSTQLQGSLTPISLGASTFMGWGGSIMMAVAALIALITTANAGILSASRIPMAMGKDELLPSFFGSVSERGTPVFSILFTSAFMICVILFLDIESLVKTASTMKILLFLMVTLSVIVMRESKIENYQPSFQSPFYPWVQIAGIIGYGFLIFQMGVVPLLLVGILIVCGLGWYWVYASGKIEREYALLHVVERVTGITSTSYLIEEELREILIERDNICEERFERLIKKCPVIDLKTSLSPDEFTKIVTNSLAERLKTSREELFKLLIEREQKPQAIIHSRVVCLPLTIQGHSKFEVILVRDREGITFSYKSTPIHGAFIIVHTPDEERFWYHSLMWIIASVEKEDFDKKWLNAQNREELRNIILSSWRKRKL